MVTRLHVLPRFHLRILNVLLKVTLKVRGKPENRFFCISVSFFYINSTPVDYPIVSSYFLILICFSMSKPIWLNLETNSGLISLFLSVYINVMENPLGYVDE